MTWMTGQSGISLSGWFAGSSRIFRMIQCRPMILAIPGKMSQAGGLRRQARAPMGHPEHPGHRRARGSSQQVGGDRRSGCRREACGRPVMASYVGLVAVIVIVIFAAGILFGVILIVAAGVKAEDQATLRRKNRELVLREEPANSLARGVRRLTGVGQRVGGPGER